MVAAYYGQSKVLKVLLHNSKIDTKARDSSGDFALHHAVKQSREKCVKLLLPVSAGKAKEYQTFLQENGVGLTPLDCAMLKEQQSFHVFSAGTQNSVGFYNNFGSNRKSPAQLTHGSVS